LNAIRSMAHTAQLGHYTEARLENYAYLQLMKIVTTELSSSLTTTTSTTSSTTATTKSQSKSSAEEVQDVLKSFTEHSRKFENTLYNEQYKEVINGRKWDDMEEKMKVLEQQKPHLFATKEKSDGFLSTLSSFVNWVLPSNTPIVTSASSSTSDNNLQQVGVANRQDEVSNSSTSNNNQQQVRVVNRQDEVSNFLWNMRGANTL